MCDGLNQKDHILGDHAIKNSKIIKTCDAVLPITSTEVQSNFSVYEALRVIKGHVVHLPEHLKRLNNSASLIGLVHPFTDVEIKESISLLIQTDNITDASLRILIVGGKEPVYFITASKILSYDSCMYKEGINCTLYFGQRFMPNCKTSNLLVNYLARKDATNKGAFEALLVDNENLICEGSRSNFYAFKDGILYTAPISMVLDGITRQSVLIAAKMLNIEVVQKAIDYRTLSEYDEAFISATSMAAMPIKKIENIEFKSDFARTLALCKIVRDREGLETL